MQRYLEVAGDQVHAIVDEPAGEARGTVVIAGPFASERIYAYPALVRFARFLAAGGWRAVRFDWRGVGESTGAFDRLGCAEWADDLRAAAALGDGPLALCGVRFGALVARDAFAAGLGDALVEWGPPATARAALGEALRRKLAEEMAAGSGGKRTRDDYIAALERGEVVDVDGYGWGLRLWESAAELDGRDGDLAGRPRLQIKLTRGGEAKTEGAAWTLPVPAPPFWWASPLLVPGLDDLYGRTSDWLGEAVAR